jgi:DUF4097 and DUF4098 domain-containing protein YvlB
MKLRSAIVFLCAAVSVAIFPRILNVLAQDNRRDEKALREREESHQTFQLSQGSKINVSETLGQIEIEPATGDSAEVDIYRSANTKEDLAYYKVNVENTTDGLALRGQGNYGADDSRIELRQKVIIKVPQTVDISVRTHTGTIKVGAIKGDLTLSAISGPVNLVQVEGYSHLSGVSGPVAISISRLNARGMNLSGISGMVKLSLASDLNAELSINNISGKVFSETSSVQLDKVGHASYRARIGSGGAPISVSGISGVVTVARK